MRCALLLAVAAIAVGCSTAQWNEMRANPREYFNLTAPTLASGASIDGRSVTLQRGQALLVRLDEDPAYGQRWEMQPFKAATVIAPVQHDFIAKAGGDAAQNGVGEAVFRLRGVEPGTQPIVLEFKRPAEPASKTIRFDVVVR